MLAYTTSLAETPATALVVETKSQSIQICRLVPGFLTKLQAFQDSSSLSLLSTGVEFKVSNINCVVTPFLSF